MDDNHRRIFDPHQAPIDDPALDELVDIWTFRDMLSLRAGADLLANNGIHSSLEPEVVLGFTGSRGRPTLSVTRREAQTAWRLLKEAETTFANPVSDDELERQALAAEPEPE